MWQVDMEPVRQVGGRRLEDDLGVGAAVELLDDVVVAPTTLSLLGLDPEALEAVVIEGTEGLDTN
jgi:hypothetical protein